MAWLLGITRPQYRALEPRSNEGFMQRRQGRCGKLADLDPSGVGAKCLDRPGVLPVRCGGHLGEVAIEPSDRLGLFLRHDAPFH